MELCRRRVQRSKNSKFVFLPKVWADEYGIEAGDQLEFEVGETGSLSIRKVGVVPVQSDKVPANENCTSKGAGCT